VIVDNIQSYQVYVMGYVARGGAFSSATPVTIMQALANAGGFTEFANKEDVRIFRGNLMMKFNYKDYTEGKNLSQNIKLESGDVLEVH
jgi:polysaccharide export outer membrane protein